MNRQHKYPDTDTFHYFNANPRNKITGDCVVRAIASATEIPYNELVMELAEYQVKTGYDPRCHLDGFIKSLGWVKHKQPRKPDNTKYTGKDFCHELSLGSFGSVGNVVANIGGHHVVAIKEIKCEDDAYRYKIYDIWNSTDGCIGNFWTKG